MQLWSAPEYLRQPDLVPSKEGDIYSAGIIVQEILTRSVPFENERSHMDIAGNRRSKHVLDYTFTEFETYVVDVILEFGLIIQSSFP